MRALGIVELLLALAATGCGTTRLVRLEIGNGPLLTRFSIEQGNTA